MRIPNPGSGQAPIFLGVATLGIARTDVGALYGSRYATVGLRAERRSRAPPASRPASTTSSSPRTAAVTGTFNNVAVVRVTLQ